MLNLRQNFLLYTPTFFSPLQLPLLFLFFLLRKAQSNRNYRIETYKTIPHAIRFITYTLEHATNGYSRRLQNRASTLSRVILTFLVFFLSFFLLFFFWLVPLYSLLQSHIDRARRFNTSFRRELCRRERRTAHSVCVRVSCVCVCARERVRVCVYARGVCGVYCFGIIVGAVRTFRRHAACLETESQTP